MESAPNFTIVEPMRVDITLRHDATGEAFTYTETAHESWAGEEDEMWRYQWGEGNYACNHNRVLFFFNEKFKR